MFVLLALAAMTGLSATEVRRVPSTATQGVASDGQSIFSISNHTIVRTDPATGKVLATWDGDPAQFKHLNSCIARQGKLLCAASNYPTVPMESMIERFDARTLKYLGRQVLPNGPGSLVWVLRHKGAWWANFANYDGRGGQPGRDHRFTTLVRYDDKWQETARWAFPEDLLTRFAPMSASGGSWGDDGLLYVTGHDRPELYALRVPDGGGVLEHVATITVPTAGQAISWDPLQRRLLWSIERATKAMVASTVPEIPEAH